MLRVTLACLPASLWQDVLACHDALQLRHKGLVALLQATEHGYEELHTCLASLDAGRVKVAAAQTAWDTAKTAREKAASNEEYAKGQLEAAENAKQLALADPGKADQKVILLLYMDIINIYVWT